MEPAHDPDTEKVIGAWGEVTIDGVEHYTSISIMRRARLEEACAIALGKAMAKSEVKNANQLLELLKMQLDMQSR
ncbi:MAG: hypothetical protein LC132_08710 [Burkholderiales bacterium]|nr:hypothetical protein [Burkholderiales bacterium]MDI9560957.1 hypothetical protein [Pseudomonadota bacterium]HOS60590.1 hypothetical protein [Syntrophorhabdaceae bacterium]HQI57466.1 hypothetical protein [Syntrophorhabdaceae bacterium]